MPRTPVRFRRFRDLDRDAINVDFQVHTTQTDGKGTIAELLHLSRQRGLSAIAFTEHVRRDTPWFGDFARAIRRTAVDFPELRVHVGCEAKALDTDGGLDASEAILAECDIVLGSVHRFPDGKGGLLDFARMDVHECAEREFSLALSLVRRAPIDVLSHPGGMTLRHHGSFPLEMFRRLMVATLERGIAIEINSSYLRDMPAFLGLCAEINPYVSVGSDVHRVEDMGRCRDTLLAHMELKA